MFQEGERKKTSTPRRDRRSLSEEDEQRTNTHVQSNLQQIATGNYDRSIESHTDQPTNQPTNQQTAMRVNMEVTLSILAGRVNR